MDFGSEGSGCLGAWQFKVWGFRVIGCRGRCRGFGGLGFAVRHTKSLPLRSTGFLGQILKESRTLGDEGITLRRL